MTPSDLYAWQSRLGMTGTEACRRLGIPYGTYREYLVGRRRLPGWLPILCGYIERYGFLSAGD